MELYLKLYVQMIDLEKSKLSGVQYKTPEELIYHFSEDKLAINDPGQSCYYLSDSQGIFDYLDKLEEQIPKECHDASWEWGGARKDNVYYVEIHGQGIVNTGKNLIWSIREVFHDGMKETGDFDFPAIARKGHEDDGPEWDENQYDDDSDLRIVEECTKGKDWVQWYRPYPETEGFSGSTLIALATLVVGTIPLIITIKDRIRIKLRRSYYACKIAQLRRIVINETHHKGHIRSPKPMPPKYINAETGQKEYLFYQILDDNRVRKVFINMDGKSIRKGSFS